MDECIGASQRLEQGRISRRPKIGRNKPASGKLQLSAGGRGTVVDITGELKVAIPLLGKKLEESAAPAVTEGYQKQQEVGDRWLAT